MTTPDVLFNCSSLEVSSASNKYPIRLRAVEKNDTTSFIAYEGFLNAFYRGDFAYCVRDYLNYGQRPRHTITSISYHLPPFEILRCVETTLNLKLLCKGSDWWAVIDIQDKSIEFEFGAHTLERGQELAERFNDGLASKDEPDTKVSFEMWAGTDYPIKRKFDDLSWRSIKGNYPSMTRQSIEQLMKLEKRRSSSDGRIILFHGPPGTGKTYAIRALLTHWKAWIKPALVLDPEHLLETPRYMISAMNGVSGTQTRLLIIEDADAIVASKGSHGGGMSRLLNAADGLIGASRDVMFLFSTNAKPRELDAAFTRPGRCLAAIEFGSFPMREASERLGDLGPAKGDLTLAEIYRVLGKTTMLSNERSTLAGQYL